MPCSQPTHRPSSADLSGDLGALQHTKDVFGASLPLHAQSPLRFPTHGLSLEVPRMAAAVQEFASSSDHRVVPTAMSLDESVPMQWVAPDNFPLNHMDQDAPGCHAPTPFTSGSKDFYHYTQNGMSYNDNFNLPYSAQYQSLNYPRTYSDLDLSGLPTLTSTCPGSYNGPGSNGLPGPISISEAYPPAAYQIEPPKHHDTMDLSDQDINSQLMQLSNDYEHHHYGSHIKAEDHSGYQSPYSDLTRASTPHDDSPRGPHDHNAREAGAIDKEQPYAQLIYKALLDATDHTMILRDIYEWFKKYTDKASASETLGWKNSIRHNLSMNGAFEKVDQTCDDAHKGFKWRLTDKAVREGVKSTTRYRSKQPNKRGQRPQNPLPQRQASGAKGGQAARRSAKMRRSNRVETYRSDPYTSRSMPAAFDPIFQNTEALMPYPPSPYYGSDVDFGYGSQDSDFGSQSVGPGIDLFGPARSYTESPLSQGMPIMDTAYVLDHSPTESLFTNSPSLSPDEPRTPESPRMWAGEGTLGAPNVHGEAPYQAYAG